MSLTKKLEQTRKDGPLVENDTNTTEEMMMVILVTLLRKAHVREMQISEEDMVASLAFLMENDYGLVIEHTGRGTPYRVRLIKENEIVAAEMDPVTTVIQ